MVMLLEGDIQTKEVLDWKGLHLFHFSNSTCSQKMRIFLRLKGIEWESHHLNLIKKENQTSWYMGINPRGLVPTIVHDGKVIIESNDILEYLEAQFPEPELIPSAKSEQVHSMLKAEDDLHLDIRALTMRFMIPSFLAKRPESALKAYESTGSGTVGGNPDPHKDVETKFWRDMNVHGKITNDQAINAFNRFKSQLSEYDQLLVNQPYLLGDTVSLVDIAWYIYVRRLISSSYPVSRLHSSVDRWFKQLDSRSDFNEEVPSGRIMDAVPGILHVVQKIRGTSLEQVIAGTK